jgi:hypothetical protein
MQGINIALNNHSNYSKEIFYDGLLSRYFDMNVVSYFMNNPNRDNTEEQENFKKTAMDIINLVCELIYIKKDELELPKNEQEILDRIVRAETRNEAKTTGKKREAVDQERTDLIKRQREALTE